VQVLLGHGAEEVHAALVDAQDQLGRQKADGVLNALRGRDTFTVTFHPPAAHRYDTDGIITRFKAGQDALAEVTGVNDFQFVMTYRRGEVRSGGSVVLE
jgi:hypothetical protein